MSSAAEPMHCSYLFMEVVLLLFWAAPTEAARSPLPTMLRNAPKAIQVKSDVPKLLPAGALEEPVPAWEKRYEKVCLAQSAAEVDPEDLFPEFQGHRDWPELGGEGLLLHLAHKVQKWSHHKHLCFHTINTFQGLSLLSPNDAGLIYGAIRQGLVRISATFSRSFRAMSLTITSTAAGPIAVSVPQGSVFEGRYTEQPLVVLSAVMVHLLPNRSQTVVLETYSLSLFGVPPVSTPRLAPFVFTGAFLHDRQHELPRSQRKLWAYTDGGRWPQISRQQKVWKRWEGRLGAPWVWAGTPAVMALVLLAYTMERGSTGHASVSQFCFMSTFMLLASGAQQLYNQPLVCAVSVLFAVADLWADAWVVTLGAGVALGAVLCVAPTHKFLLGDYPRYALLSMALGIGQFASAGDPLQMTSVLSAALLSALYIPEIIFGVLGLGALAKGGKAAVQDLHAYALPCIQAVVYPALGAPLVVWGLWLALGDHTDGLQQLDSFALDPVMVSPSGVLLPWLGWAAVGLYVGCVVMHGLMLRQATQGVEPKEAAKQKKVK